MTTVQSLVEMYEAMRARFGHQGWWPVAEGSRAGERALEICIGAILTQNTNWKNVEKAIDGLRRADLLRPHALYEVPPEELEEWIRPAGYFRIKARRLRSLLELLVRRYDGSLEAMFSTGASALRGELLGVHGIGPETADSILLYAGGLPVFVVDTYTHRVLTRHGWIGFDADYHQIQDTFQGTLPEDVDMYNEYHALLVHVGKHYCRKREPKCGECPLAELLPDGGPLEPED